MRTTKIDDLEARMREPEWFHTLRAPPGAWMVLRVDGRSSSSLTEREFTKPFDDAFHASMLAVAESLFVEFNALLAYTESDEISILLRPETDLFNREVEKLVSISAGIASATFALKSGLSAHFDSRLWIGVTQNQVVDYFRWRQAFRASEPTQKGSPHGSSLVRSGENGGPKRFGLV